MKALRKAALITASVVLAVAILSVSFALIHVYSERRKAEAFLNVLRQIRVGVTDQTQVMRMTAPFQTHRYVFDNDPEMEFLFFNEWLVQLRLAVPAEFRAYIRIKDGVVGEKSAREAAGIFGCIGRVRESKRGALYGHQIEPNQLPNHRVYWEEHAPEVSRNSVRSIRIDDDDTYPESLRQKDWNFDLSCLTRLGGGCSDTRVMLPAATRPTFESPAE